MDSSLAYTYHCYRSARGGKKKALDASLGKSLMRDRFKGKEITRGKDSQALVRYYSIASHLLIIMNVGI